MTTSVRRIRELREQDRIRKSRPGPAAIGAAVIVAVEHGGRLHVFSWEQKSDWDALVHQVGAGRPYARIQAALVEDTPP